MTNLTIVPLGPGPGDLLTLGALSAMHKAQTLVLRTGVHPVADYLKGEGVPFATLDHLHGDSDDFDVLAQRAAEYVLKLSESGPVVYAVPDPSQDESVRVLRAMANGPPVLLPGVPLAAPALANAPMDAPVIVSSAMGLKITDAQHPAAISEINTRALAGDVKLKLLAFHDADTPVHFYPPSQEAARPSKRIALEELDRQEHYDHTALALVLPKAFADKQRYDVQDLIDLMARLRAPDGCPWDREQTHQTLAKYLIEEAYETAAAIRQEDWAHVADELGDVLLQVVFHANVGEQYGTLDLTDITTAVCQKMIARHPHIFRADKALTSRQVLTQWESIKAKERGEETLTDRLRGIGQGLPALLRAHKAQERAAKVGFDFPDALEALKKVVEEAREVQEAILTDGDYAGEVGDLFFSCVNVARLLEVDPEETVDISTDTFIKRLEWMEKAIHADKKVWEQLTLSSMDVYWCRSKGMIL
ncbi:MAG: nucleoside triphosphate pyrophosphohydrolase [Clostridiales bacterium]|nr:nucleoside triphosphate pyrophosphohydrolase [Clostridiales bacterium]